ncbi:MAG: threonine transporter RhtB, partial [Rhodospirillaceae bacterium]
MANYTLLSLFIPTFFFVSITPGLCMTLALTMGMTLGLRKALWMMTGELLGVGAVSVAAVLGVAALVVQYPDVFIYLKFAGGTYLAFIGVQMWLSRGRMALNLDGEMPNETNR